MLTALPFCNFKSYCANTKVNLILIYRHADCLIVSKGGKIRNQYNQVPYLTQDTHGKVTFILAANNQYAFKKYTPLILQVYMLLTANVLLLNAVL